MPERNIVITGASSGLGRDLAREYCARGDRVVALARRPKEDAGLDAGVDYLRWDLGELDTLTELADALVARCPQPDIIVHNAALYASLPPDDLANGELEHCYRVNALAPYLLSRALLRRPPANFVLFAMINSECAYHTGTNVAAYSASKAALLAFTRSLALEFKSRACSFATLVLGPLASERKAAGVQRLAERLNATPEEATRKWLAVTYPGAVMQDFIQSRSVARSLDALYELGRDGNGAIWRLDGGSIDLLF